jgi:hypothetical protein
VVNSKDDLTPSQTFEEGDPIPDISQAGAYEDPTIFSFTIDAVTGEWVMISENQPAPQRGEGLGKAVTRAELETLMKQPPAQLEEYIAIAKEFAEKHFNLSKVSGAEFDCLYFQYNSKSLNAGNDTVEILEKGTTISIKVTDDTGRAALVSINMDTNKAFALDTKDSDHIPGYNHEGIYDGV